MPGPGSPQSWDRYAYVNNNPINYSDPSGHRVTIGAENDDLFKEYSRNDYIKMIKDDFGLTVSDGVQIWGNHDMITMYIALQRMSAKDVGFLTRINGAVIKYSLPSSAGFYSGWTSNQSITFYADPGKIPYQNIYHKFAHVFDNSSDDVFSKVLDNYSGYAGDIFVFGINSSGKYDRQDGLGYISENVWDPNRNMYVAAEQHKRSWEPYGNTGSEEWADMYANYIAGNINLDSLEGYRRYGFIPTILSLTSQ